MLYGPAGAELGLIWDGLTAWIANGFKLTLLNFSAGSSIIDVWSDTKLIKCPTLYDAAN